MIKVRATDMSSKLRVGIKELGRIAFPDEEFEVSNIRYTVLTGKNQYHAVFVRRVKDETRSAKVSTPLNNVMAEQAPVVEKPKKNSKKRR